LGAVPTAAQDIAEKVASFFSIGAGIAIVPVYLFFFLAMDRDVHSDLDAQLVFLGADLRKDLLFLVREFVGSLEAFFRGQILIGMIIGALLAIAFSLIGVNFGIGLGLFIGALNIVPYLGTIIGLGLVLPIAYFQPDGGWLMLGLALLSFILVQLLEGYLLTPKIMGKQTGLHPLTIIVAIFFWGVALDGLLGMVLAIPLTAFFVVAWRLAKRKYLRYFSGEQIEEVGDETPPGDGSETDASSVPATDAPQGPGV
jgi:predicted PurR-regulated permease PerM